MVLCTIDQQCHANPLPVPLYVLYLHGGSNLVQITSKAFACMSVFSTGLRNACGLRLTAVMHLPDTLVSVAIGCG